MLRLGPALLLLSACAGRPLGLAGAPATAPTPSSGVAPPTPRCARTDWRKATLLESTGQDLIAVAADGDEVHVVHPSAADPTRLIHAHAPLGTTTLVTEPVSTPYGPYAELGVAAATPGELAVRATAKGPTAAFVVVSRRDAAGAWTHVAGPDQDAAAGNHSIVLGPDGIAHTTYVSTMGQLTHLARGPQGWTEETIELTGTFAATIALDANGRAVAAAVDGSGQVAASWQDGHGGWLTQFIGDAVHFSSGAGGVDLAPALAVDWLGRLHVVYDGGAVPFTYAVGEPAGAWGTAAPPAGASNGWSAWDAIAIGADHMIEAAYQSGHDHVLTVAVLGDGSVGEVVDHDGAADHIGLVRDARGGTHVVYHLASDDKLHYAYRCE